MQGEEEQYSLLLTLLENVLITSISAICTNCTVSESIENGRLLCCADKPELIVYQAKIVSIHVNEIISALQKWKSSKPALNIQGLETPLSFADMWYYNMSSFVITAHHAYCGIGVHTDRGGSTSDGAADLPRISAISRISLTVAALSLTIIVIVLLGKCIFALRHFLKERRYQHCSKNR